MVICRRAVANIKLEEQRERLVENKVNKGKVQSLVSVVIPTYNREALLRRAILSVQKQTHKNLEIIVVDDASEDRTADVINELDDNRIRYIKHNTCRGGSAARNTGIDFSLGEYITFLDDDDEWMENKVECQLKDVCEYDGVLCSAFIAGQRRSVRSYNKTIVDVNDLKKGFVFSGGTNILFAKTEVLRRVKFDENLNSGQDWDLMIRIASDFSIRYVDQPLVIYHNEAHNRITNKVLAMSIEEIDNHLGIIKKHRNFLGEYWYRYHMARGILSYIGKKDKKLNYIKYAINRCGIMPVLRVFSDRTIARLRHSLARLH
jgi:GalNAc5-diNAcBac-PP-undecaprenol beta-1,3-glucosyltransferase